ncbi:phenylacetaldehyde reductase-like isoform X1 [Eucalyptus grandis]|uniref:phenylacetaldehyde reductase-like isoform X1 n=2 Tax=Eucalyptus grandis TaxID=71139 RepID=UPI00192EF671|nr:phenylacetaldehyde reductase-like isoform X1 [Eucalyptus grandis]XP_039172575.1 phenylacetaldehyde reductase-like isoform X1 [Eucalyptus grandis]
MSTTEKVVCVTGGAGYIASWLIDLLLHRGYTVKATIRNTNDSRKTQHLLALEGAKERLHLFKADLLEEGSFDSIVDGCGAVFHTASPVVFSASDPQAEIVDPAVRGTLNVLKSCAKVPSIKRVVVTSSMAAVVLSGKPLTSGVVVDETWFSDPVFCEESKLWYMLSKTLAEKAAREFAKEKRIDLVVMNPGHVIGPLLQPTVNLSVELILNFLNGTEEFPNASYGFVDVRDVARAHIQALQNSSASGRYCIVGGVMHRPDMSKILHHLYPTLRLLEKCEDDKPAVVAHRISREKVEGLGVNFIPLEVSIKETVESLKEKGFLSF